MGRYFFIYLILVTLICVSLEFVSLTNKGSDIHWNLSDFSFSASRDTALLVMPENFQVENVSELTKVFADNVLSTEPLRSPEESTSDIIHHFNQGTEKYELFCVEKAAYDCIEFLSRGAKYSARVKKLYIIFPDAHLKKAFTPESLSSIDSFTLTANKKPLLQRLALWVYDFYFEVNHSFKRFISKDKEQFLSLKSGLIRKYSAKIEVLRASSL
jgi:hypothetical protein